MSVTEVLLDILIVLVAAKVAAEIAERISVPAVVGEIVAGVIIGPSVLSLVGGDETLKVLGELGVILLLLGVGMEMDLGDVGLARFTDLETGEKITIHSQQVRESYREAVRQRIQTLRTLAASRRVDWMLARTDESYFALLDRLAH